MAALHKKMYLLQHHVLYFDEEHHYISAVLYIDHYTIGILKLSPIARMAGVVKHSGVNTHYGTLFRFSAIWIIILQKMIISL